MEKGIKNIRFVFQVKGRLKKVHETPIGNIWVNADHRVWYFDGEETGLSILQTIITFDAITLEIEEAKTLLGVIHTFYRVTEVSKVVDNVFFEINLRGELEPVVESASGIMYINTEHQLWYFKPCDDSQTAASLSFRTFVAGLKRQADDTKEARYILRLMRSFFMLSNHCIGKEVE